MANDEIYPKPCDVPPPPDDLLWSNVLKWCVFVMNDADPQRHFASSCLTWCLKKGGLTEKQATACQRMVSRITAHYDAGSLECQSEAEDAGDVGEPIRVGVH